jgi:heme oxygenase (biliverdin-IX-beta and delta-forming)
MTLHSRLKIETADEHTRLEQDVSRMRFFDSLPGYLDYLHRFGAFQAAMEAALEAQGVQTVIRDWDQRRRAHLAHEDLRALGEHDALVSANSPEGAQGAGRKYALLCLPQHDPAKDGDPARVLGMAYVIEGATLGGAVLLKGLAQLGITADRGGSFLASYGPARGRMWQSFMATLAEWDQRGIAHERVLQSARDAFGTARRYLVG